MWTLVNSKFVCSSLDLSFGLGISFFYDLEMRESLVYFLLPSTNFYVPYALVFASAIQPSVFCSVFHNLTLSNNLLKCYLFYLEIPEDLVFPTFVTRYSHSSVAVSPKYLDSKHDSYSFYSTLQMLKMVATL